MGIVTLMGLGLALSVAGAAYALHRGRIGEAIWATNAALLYSKVISMMVSN